MTPLIYDLTALSIMPILGEPLMRDHLSRGTAFLELEGGLSQQVPLYL